MKAQVLALSTTMALIGCPSKESTPSSSGATPPSSGNGTGPLAALESSPFMNEVWTAQEGGAQMPMLFYSRENIRISAQCRNASGQLACDAIRQMRSGTPVQIPRRSLTGNVSAGTRVCMNLRHQLVNAHNSVGAEDGFCRFPDGSLVSTGALEQYAMNVVE
jgi:hypothetical protein